MLWKSIKWAVDNVYANIIASLILLLILGYIDIITGYELSFQFFYFIPLALFANNLTYKNWAIFSFAFLTTLVWLSADILADKSYSLKFLYVWNAMSRAIVFCFFSFFLNSIIKQRVKMQLLNMYLQKKENTINESITYARTLQNSLIHTYQNTSELFKDFFVIDLPKNTLSGDYFWYYENKKYTFITIVDCIGHGIPGSILSVISNLLLKKIIAEKEISETSEILKELHFDTINALNAGEDTIEDGMEVCIVRYEKKNQEITFSQTSQSLIIFSPDSNFVIPESNGYTIGSYLSRRNGNNYTSNKAKLEKGSWLYMFTDGVLDQFNSENTEKYGIERFLLFLKSINHQSGTYKSEAFLKELNSWKGSNTNTDDITLIGFTII